MPDHVSIDRYGDKDRSGALGGGGVIARHPPNPGRHETVAADDHAAALDMAHDPFPRKLGNLGRHGQR